MKRESKQNRGPGNTKVVGFQVIEEECIWMKAGVVKFHLCNNAFDCFTCPFDHAMQRAVAAARRTAAGRKTTWHAEMNRKPGLNRMCRHSLSGRIQVPKICPMNYECYHCHYDQMLDDDQLSKPEGIALHQWVSGFQVADGYYYHLGHGWARIEHGGRVRIGLDDFASRVFGPKKTWELPHLGTQLKQGEPAWAFSVDGRRAEVLSPITGTVLAVNAETEVHPEIAHSDPYQVGWLFIVEPDTLKENLKGLYFGNESVLWIEKESQQLMKLLGPEYEKMAATGGRIIDDIFGEHPNLSWKHLAHTFLRTGEA